MTSFRKRIHTDLRIDDALVPPARQPGPGNLPNQHIRFLTLGSLRNRKVGRQLILAISASIMPTGP